MICDLGITPRSGKLLRMILTHVLVCQVLSESAYNSWLIDHKNAEADMMDREQALMDSACRIESDLELLGECWPFIWLLVLFYI